MMMGNGGDHGNERFEALYRRHYGRVLRYYLRFGVANPEAQDLAQEAFKRIYESFDQWRAEAEWSFIETVAHRVLLNWVRARQTIKRNAPIIEIDNPGVAIDPPAPEPPDYAERQQHELRKKRLYAAIEELPSGQRQCVQLWLEELQYDEIASALKTTVDAVKSRLRDAKKQLRARLGDDGSLPEVEE